MAEVKEPEFTLIVDEVEERVMPSHRAIEIQENTIPQTKNKKWWAWIITYTLLVLIGQSSATLLGRLYYIEGGNTILLAALLETIGFPILIPFALYFSSNNLPKNDAPANSQPSYLIKSAVYIFLGLFQAASGVLYAIGMQNLPVSTYSLINSTQLAFNALFSFFLNAQKITFLILNALVLVTISSTLVIFQSDNERSVENSRREHFLLGFLCTLTASALYSLMLSVTQIAFQKVLKMETFSTVLNMVIYQSLVATCVVMLPIFISGKWCDLRNEMENFDMGKSMFVMVLVMIAVGWQVNTIGAVGLIFEVSSLFSNVISTVGLPIIPILAAVFFHEKMDGIKVVSILLAVWGFVSYVYQNYLNGYKSG